MDVVDKVCPPNFAEQVKRFDEQAEEEVNYPSFGVPASYRMTAIKQIRPGIPY